MKKLVSGILIFLIFFSVCTIQTHRNEASFVVKKELSNKSKNESNSDFEYKVQNFEATVQVIDFQIDNYEYLPKYFHVSLPANQFLKEYFSYFINSFFDVLFTRISPANAP